MGNISKLPKDRMIRPSVIGAVDKINEIIDDVNETDDDLATLTNKVEGLIVEGGEPNVIESVSLNGEPLPVVDKNVDVSAITTKTTQGPAYGPLLSVTAEGHAEQDRTTGKNLFGAALNKLISGSVVQGFSFVNGGTSFMAMVANNTTYTVRDHSAQAGNRFRMVGFVNEPSATSSFDATEIYFNNDANPRQYTFDSGASNWVVLTVDSQTYYSDAIAQLELGSTATDYEPYTGGIPSPNPDYPQEIRVARGRNLLEKFAFSSETRNGITWTVNTDGSISASGTATADSSFLIVNKSQYDAGIEPGVTYTASGGDGQDVQLQFWSNVTGAISDAFQTATFSLSGTESNWNVALIVKNGKSVDKTVYPQLELGSIPTRYVPYGHVGLEVQGRNLLDERLLVLGYGLDSTTGVRYKTSSTGWSATEHVECASIAGKTVSKENMTGIAFYDSSKVYLRGYGTGAVTFAVPENAVYLIAEAETEFIGSIQLELGSTVHDYQPYHHTTTPIPLPSRGWVGSLPDGTHDALSIDGAGKVTWELADEEIVFDGSESWGTVNNGKRVGISANLLPAISNIRQQSSSTETFACYCTHFAASTPSKTWAGTQGISGQQGQQEIHIADGSGSMTVSGWKTWLQSNPVTVLYPLATPVTESMGYVDLPDIPEGAVVSMPELEGLGVESWTSDAVARYVRAWAERLSMPSTLLPAGE